MSNMNGPARHWIIWGKKVGAPSSGMVKIRAGLMKSAFTRKERAQIPGLTPGFEQQRAALLLACDKPLQARLRECGRLDQHGNRRECGVVFCPRCLMLRRGRQSRENIKLFAPLGNGGLAFMTVLVRVVSDLKDARDIQEKFALKVRNAIMAKRQKDTRWNNVMVKAYWEFDHLWDSDDLGRNTKIALPLLGLPDLIFDSHWLLHFHAIVALGDITIDELKSAMKRKNAPHPYQVDVQPFRADRDVNWNIRQITRYSMKYRIENHYKRSGPFDPDYEFDMEAANERKWWPQESVRLLVVHLSQPLHGYRSSQFWIGPKATPKSQVGEITPLQIDGDVEALVPEPVLTEEEKAAKASEVRRDLITRMKAKRSEDKT